MLELSTMAELGAWLWMPKVLSLRLCFIAAAVACVCRGLVSGAYETPRFCHQCAVTLGQF